MNILIVCPRLCHGGAERVAVCLANGFVKRRHEIRFMSDLYEEVTYTLDNRVQISNLISAHNNKIQKWFGAIRNVRNEVKRNKPDIIIGIMPLCSLIAKIATIGIKIPIIATEHNAFEKPKSSPMPITERLYKFHINKIFDQVTVLTEADKKVIDKRLKNVTVMSNPLVIDPITLIPPQKKYILAAGRIDNWYVKGFDILLQAWSKIISNEQLEISNYDYSQDGKPSHWWLKIAGIWRGEDTIPYLTGIIPDGEWKNLNDNDNDDDNKSAVWRSEKYHIEFLGFRKDIEELYKKSSIFVLSSRYEGFGLVLIEAMSQGCAPVACDYKGRQREILNPSSALPEGEGEPNRKIEITENGILCEPDDVEALASALKKMMEDEDYRKKVQQNAVERSKFYDMEHTMNRWEEYLNKVIS